MIDSDIVDYSNNFVFIKSFLDEVFKSVNIGKIAEDNKFINFDKSLIADDYIAFYISNNNSIKLTFFITLRNKRLYDFGFKTPKDIQTIWTRGYYFDEGNGVAGYSYKGVELLFNKKTKVIITIRPAKKGR